MTGDGSGKGGVGTVSLSKMSVRNINVEAVVMGVDGGAEELGFVVTGLVGSSVTLRYAVTVPLILLLMVT